MMTIFAVIEATHVVSCLLLIICYNKENYLLDDINSRSISTKQV